MVFNMAASMPLNVFAAGGDTKIYKKDSYEVTYNVVSEWDKHQNIQVKVSNTGEESILNWALKYDTCGEIDGIWNANIYSSDEEYIVVKNSGYNYEIEPGQSVTYGYTLVADEFAMPEDIELCSRRIDVKSGYEAELRIGSEWNDGFTGEIVVSNTSEEPIEAWTLSFDGNFDINNLWNGKLLSSESRCYEVANQLWTNPIKPGESASFGFTAIKTAGEKAKIKNISLTSVVIGDSSLEKDIHSQDDPHTENIDIDYELDSDGDSLPDYYEDEIGTDKNSEDTDGDGLNDGYELIYLGTDPLKQDTDGNGINDGNEDPDKDGLTNVKESELNTDPNSDDTDNDGLSDGEEVKKYGTDPLKFDTDGDDISDGDEVSLGLDPKKNATDGTPDNERTFVQPVDTDAECLSEINDNDENPFDVSLEVKAAGVAANNIYAHKSGYSNVIANSAIIGVAPEFEYTDGLSVEEVTVKFNVENSITKNTLGIYVKESDEFKGIKRLNVFMFIEDVNMLLPIETFHDEKNNTVYAKTDRMGTYCLVDMEIFLDNLSNQLETAEVEKSSASSKNSVDNDGYFSYNVNRSTAASNYKEKDNFDVTFIIDNVNYDQNKIEKIKEKILVTSEQIFDMSSDVNIHVYSLNSLNGKPYTHIGDAKNITTLKSILSNVHHKTQPDANLSSLIDDIYKKNNPGRENYCFVFYDGLKATFRIHNDSRATLNSINAKNRNINISICMDMDKSEVYHYQTLSEKRMESQYAVLLFSKTNGMYVNDKDLAANNFMTKAIKHIYDRNVFKAIIATGYKSVELDDTLQNIYNCYVASKNSTVDTVVKGATNSDPDSLYDYQEIMFEYIDEWDNEISTINNTNLCAVELYTYGQIIDKICFEMNPDRLFYVQKGLERYTKATDEEGAIVVGSLLDAPILPINSDPTSEDSDGDGKKDDKDKSILNDTVEFSNVLYRESDLNLDASNKVKFSYKQRFVVDFNWFSKNPSIFNSELATSSAVFSGLAYHTSDIKNEANSDRISRLDKEYCYMVKNKDNTYSSSLDSMEEFGFEGVKTINLRDYYSDNHLIQFDIGYKDISMYDGDKNYLLAVFVRGTHGTKEWLSNFDIGDTDEWIGNTDWHTKANHMGFDIAAWRSYKLIKNYCAEKSLNSNNTSVWLTGHSRGAAVSGIISSYFIDDNYCIYSYNFATPNQVETDCCEKDLTKYKSIFNVINTDDIVPELPLTAWNFNKYGEVMPENFTESCKNTWSSKNIDLIYQNNNVGKSEAINAFADICTDRNNCYRYNTTIDGNGLKLYSQYFMDYNYYKKTYERYPIAWYRNDYYRVNQENGLIVVDQKPIFFMQVLACIAASDSNYDNVLFITSEYTALGYSNAASKFASFSVRSGFMNPHYVDAYIILCEGAG